MAFFDFLKKKELFEIENLKHDIENLKLDVEEKRFRIFQLSKYEGVLDTELKTKELLENAINEASYILLNARKEAHRLLDEADILLSEAKSESEILRNEAKIESDNTRLSAKHFASELKTKAEYILNQATISADKILKDAKIKAEEIAGDAYNLKNEAVDLEKTIVALRNAVKSYGDDYIIPSYSLLDQLADDFGYTEAGDELKRAREKSRLLIKNRIAAKCDYVEDYRKTTAVNFITDAFNGKVDSILSSVKQDNFGTLKQKIIDSFHLVNNLGKAFRNAVITGEYLESRLNELKYAVILIELKRKEQEEQRQIKEQLREEEKVRRDIEKALRDSAKEEEMITKAMDKLRSQMTQASVEQRLKFEGQIAELEIKWKEAEERNQRAISMAQQTKSGHVYIISNIGSFGENVYKIGMTRRLEPLDRVRELGDASVPFPFDVHAMIWCENAPTLETDLHRFFVKTQLNKTNPRKEFFKLSLKDIREKIEGMNVATKWTMLAEAAQYRESLAIEKAIEADLTLRKEWELEQSKQMADIQNVELQEIDS